VATDFFDRPFPEGAVAPPGPFAGPRPGENRLTLWAEPLPAGEPAKK